MHSQILETLNTGYCTNFQRKLHLSHTTNSYSEDLWWAGPAMLDTEVDYSTLSSVCRDVSLEYRNLSGTFAWKDVDSDKFI